MTEHVDVLVLGASGVAGRFVLKELDEVAVGEQVVFGVAGRSAIRLEDAVRSMVVHRRPEDIPVFEFDAAEWKEVVETVKMAKAVINCIGPYRKYGDKIVSACVSEGIGYVDICGEPQFIERQLRMHGKSAVLGSSSLILSCGFDSVPADIGVLHAASLCPKGVALNHIESYIGFTGRPRINKTTYESFIEEMGDSDGRRKMKERLEMDNIKCLRFRKRVKPQMLPFFDYRARRWAIRFPSCDHIVVKRSQVYLFSMSAKAPIQYCGYFYISSIIGVIFAMVLYFTILALCRFEYGREILLKYPGVFSGGLVGTPEAPGTSEAAFWMRFDGYDDTNRKDPAISVVLHGKEPVYVTTAISCVQACMMVIKGRVNAGIFTPGMAFGADGEYVRRLEGRGLIFEQIGRRSRPLE